MNKAWKARMEELKPFFLILLCTILVWMGAAMSDVQNYMVVYRVTWKGVDTARFAVTDADTSVQVMLQSSGFNALGRSLHKRYQNLVIDVSHSMPPQHGASFAVTMDTRSTVMLSNQRYRLSGIRGVSSAKEHLQLRLAERHSKVFKPSLAGVEYTFVPQFGVDGQPQLRPDSIWLYGSEASLAKIAEVRAVPTVVANIGKSGYHRIDLDSSCWSKYRDVRPSSRHVDIFIPVQRFAEKTFSMPLQVLGIDSTVRINLYPPKVNLTVWVPTKDYAKLTDKDFKLAVRYSDTLVGNRLAVQTEVYPSTVRIKEIEPSNVRFVVIK